MSEKKIIECDTEQYYFLVEQMEERRLQDYSPRCPCCLDMGYTIDSPNKIIYECECQEGQE